LILRARIDPSKVHVIPNAVDPSKFLPDPSQRAKDRIKVVVVSRLVYRKGVDLLVGIIPKICKELPEVDFIIGGDGAKRLALQEMVERERLQERVEFLGGVPHAQVRNVLIRGHVFLNCSLTESFCIAILEAASCGLLVVSTNVGGVPEVLPPDMMLLAEPSVSSLVTKLKSAIQRQAGPDAADAWDFHRRVDKMYSWTRVAKETTGVYEEVMDRGRLSYMERLECYMSLGGFAGAVACLLAMTFELWVSFVEWWLPRDAIDVVPDLVGANSVRKTDNGDATSDN
jgi:phosphatidylinositol glycan class A protein